MTVNKHGLARTIPDAVKTAVRKKCRFGCVICGAIPYDYDHFLVPYAEATEHNPDDIILLCDEHHRKKTGGLIDNDFIKSRMRKLGDREAKFRLDAGQKFHIGWPSIKVDGADHTFEVDGEPVLHIEMQPEEEEPILLSGSFNDLAGNEICRIVKNEFTMRSSRIGDFLIKSNRFQFKTPDGRTTLFFKLTNEGINIEYIFFVKKDCYLFGDSNFIQAGNSQVGVKMANNRYKNIKYIGRIQSAYQAYPYHTRGFPRINIIMENQEYEDVLTLFVVRHEGPKGGWPGLPGGPPLWPGEY